MSLFIVGGAALRLGTCLIEGRLVLRRFEVAHLRLLEGRLVRDGARRFRFLPPPSSYCANSEKIPELFLKLCLCSPCVDCQQYQKEFYRCS